MLLILPVPLLFYNIFLFLYRSAIHIVSAWDPKAKKWVNGRRLQQSRLRELAGKPGKRIWMHCASLGEFEQGRPVLEKLKQLYPEHSFIITFFSPSGYEVVVNRMPDAHIFYLPMGSRKGAIDFINTINPSLVIWVKYEYWYHYLSVINKKNIPCLLVSSVFRKDQVFFRWYGNLHRKMLSFFTHLFVQHQQSVDLLKSIGVQNCSVSGDTRFDRVTEIAAGFQPIPVIEKFVGNKKCIVAGSTWKEDEEIISRYIKENKTGNDYKWIIAPHEITKTHLKEIKDLFPSSVFFSESNDEMKANVLIIDNIGMLSRLYKYGEIAFIGGGFGNEGVHNVLEAAVYGRPVVFGPIYYQFKEAEELITDGGAISVVGYEDFITKLNKIISNREMIANMSRRSGDYVIKNKGATQKVISYIQEKRLLTNS